MLAKTSQCCNKWCRHTIEFNRYPGLFLPNLIWICCLRCTHWFWVLNFIIITELFPAHFFLRSRGKIYQGSWQGAYIHNTPLVHNNQTDWYTAQPMLMVRYTCQLWLLTKSERCCSGSHDRNAHAPCVGGELERWCRKAKLPHPHTCRLHLFQNTSCLTNYCVNILLKYSRTFRVLLPT